MTAEMNKVLRCLKAVRNQTLSACEQVNILIENIENAKTDVGVAETMSIEEAAEALHYHKNSIRAFVRQGRLVGIKAGSRYKRITKASVVAFSNGNGKGE